MCTKVSFPAIILIHLVVNVLSSSCSFSQQTAKQDSLVKQGVKPIPTEHEVPGSNNVHELAQGMPIGAFAKGGKKEKELNDFITEQKVAGLMILQDGKIRLERYALEHNKSKRWSSLSVAKSVTSTLVGAAIKDGYIKSVNDLVTDYIPGLKSGAYDSVTIRHLLTMTTGIRWSENYTDKDGDIAKFSTAPVEPGVDATVSYMKQLPAEAKPGEKFLYSTGATHLLGVVVSEATHQTLAGYLSARIWKPYGMEQTATWTLNRTGKELAGCCLQMTLSDFARFGQFVLEGGRINGESVVPGDWFTKATQIQVPLWPGGGYGYGWWIFKPGTFDALGIYGQRIHIDPSRRLVIAVNSAWPEADSNERQFAFFNFLASITSELDKEQKETE